MRPAAILREAWRDIASGTARTVTFALVLTCVSVGLAAAELTTVRALTAAAEAFQAAGASITTLAATGRIDGTACSALAAVPGVRAAGAIRATSTPITAAALPSTTIPSYEVTAGFPSVLRATTTGNAGTILSDQAADALALHAGNDLTTATGSIPVAGVYAYPSDGRRPGFGYAALSEVPTSGTFDECWVDVWPTSTQIPTLLQTTLLPDGPDAQQPVLSQLNTTLGARFDGDKRFNDRITRHAPALAAILAFTLGYLAVRTRRIQHAAALHAGLSKADLATITGIETLSWTLPAALLTAATITIYTTTGADPIATTILGARIGLPAATTPLLGAATALALTHERHLFRYVKDR